MRNAVLGAAVAPNSALMSFEMDEEAEKARVILPEGRNEECIEEAISTCPVECISWEE